MGVATSSIFLLPSNIFTTSIIHLLIAQVVAIVMQFDTASQNNY